MAMAITKTKIRDIKGLPLLGSALELRSDPLAFATKCAALGDVVRFKVAGKTCYWLFHRQAVEDVFVRQQAVFDKSMFEDDFARFLGSDSVLVAKGRRWALTRRAMQPAFDHKKVVGYATIMGASAAFEIQRWNAGTVIEMQTAMSRITLDIIARSMFGVLGQDKMAEIATCVNTSIATQGLMQQLPQWLPIPAVQRFAHAARRFADLVTEAMNRDEAQQGLMGLLIGAVDEDSNPINALDQARTMFTAGYETTANTLTWAMYQLALNPGIEDIARAEVEQVVGGRALTAADFPRLSYIQQIIKETMRLYPAAGLLTREAAVDTVVTGLHIRAATPLFFSPYMMHRNPEYFPNPEHFDPERFGEGREREIPKYAYAPFGAGPRICIGRDFALMEATIVLATILQQTRLSLVPGQKVVSGTALPVRPKYGLKMQVQHNTNATTRMARYEAS